jgi:hypothetical protein
MNPIFKDKEFLNPAATYRSLPLWSWNDWLTEDELQYQIQEMKRAGLGGFFMHARAGLRTPYMDKEWMKAVETCIITAEQVGLEAWCYDENGWPSGSANGVVPQKGKHFQQKWLEWQWIPRDAAAALETAKQDEDLLYLVAGAAGSTLAVYCKVNPYYIDLLDPMVVKDFIAECHESYYKQFQQHFGQTLMGIFSDEFKFHSIPWSNHLPEAYTSLYGEDLLSLLPLLLLKAADLPSEAVRENALLTRYRFWKLVSQLFVDSAKTVGDWCKKHNWQFTGHIMGEDTLASQMKYTAGVMPFYEYMDIPGIDLLGRNLTTVMLPKQVSSVAKQLGKKYVISETFGCCGWDLPFTTMKQIAEWQFMLGVNKLCPHLQAYSLKGIRKRDYPPSLYYQQPWWESYWVFNDYFARLTYLLTLGESSTELLIIHPLHSAWLTYGPDQEEPTNELSAQLETLSRELLSKQFDFDYGDETIISTHGRISGNQFVIGVQAYRIVILPGLLNLEASTFALLQSFVNQGGTVCIFGQAPQYIAGKRDKELINWGMHWIYKQECRQDLGK